ncbi:hypothetical protein AVEN_114729-1 [Araneus ventricosus]|uniref:Uncharacterized protein n=1 Tax=Araneus ventricosus TaxID=182803 RepID=A0A4Y2SDL5_ARAVE|nr:hypothetical protein AVEN_6468-1 [Araneus ventricosus]GBN86326.1 hypothetical protein AVEN_114729-1 [Araneus ventricosus]
MLSRRHSMEQQSRQPQSIINTTPEFNATTVKAVAQTTPADPQKQTRDELTDCESKHTRTFWPLNKKKEAYDKSLFRRFSACFPFSPKVQSA